MFWAIIYVVIWVVGALGVGNGVFRSDDRTWGIPWVGSWILFGIIGWRLFEKVLGS